MKSDDSQPEQRENTPRRFDLRVVLLTTFVAPHKLHIYFELAKMVSKMTVLVSKAMEADREWKAEWGELDVRVQNTSTFHLPWRHRLFRATTYLHIPWDTLRILKALKPDVIIAHEFGFRTFFSAIYRFLNPGTTLIIWAALSEHTELGKGFVRRLFRRFLLRFADIVVVNGFSGARYLEKLGAPMDRVLRFPYATIPTRFDQVAPERGPNAADHLVFSGRLIELKGLVPFIRGLARWALVHPERELTFTLVGGGPVQKEIDSQSIPKNLRIITKGHGNYDDVADGLENASIFAFPSLSDDWGMAVNEAMQSGLPVLGSVHSQSVNEMIVEGENGWRYRTEVSYELDRAIEAALSTPFPKLVEMGKNARRRILHRTPAYSAGYLLKAIYAGRQRLGLDMPETTMSHSSSPESSNGESGSCSRDIETDTSLEPSQSR